LGPLAVNKQDIIKNHTLGYNSQEFYKKRFSKF